MNRAVLKQQHCSFKMVQKRQDLGQLLIEPSQQLVFFQANESQMVTKAQFSSLDKNLVRNSKLKENRPPEKPNIKVNSNRRDDSRGFTKDDILNRIKKLNAQSNYQSEAVHVRYKSSLNQNASRNTSLTFHQILKEYSQKSNSSRLNQNLLNKYGNKEIIYEEPSPFQEAKVNVMRATSAQDNFPVNLKVNEKQVEMDNLISELHLEQKSRKISVPQNHVNSKSREDNSNSQSRTRIKESFFQQEIQKIKLSSNESASSRIVEQKLKENKLCNNNYIHQQQAYLADKQILSNTKKANIEQLQKSLENMCSLSSQQLNLMQETKLSLAPNVNIFRKTSNRCVSADINLLPPIDNNDDSCVNHNTASDNIDKGQCQLNLACEEEVKIDEDLVLNEVAPVPLQIHDSSNSNNNNAFDSTTIAYLCDRERRYLPDPHYLSSKQKDITSTMRAILIDWMMEVSCEYHLKRETFYLATYYVDRYLSKQCVSKHQLQLIGLTSMFMASKIEEIIPQKANSFARSADYGYSVEQILETELKMLQACVWEVNPPTINLWLNWYMGQWDLFYTQKDASWCGFKQSQEESFQLFKKLTQLIDCAVLDIETLQYQPRTIVASFMYLVIAFKLGVYDDQMIDEFSRSSLFLLDQSNHFNLIFDEFIRTTFGFYLTDLLPSIQYASTFLRVKISNDAPPGAATLANTPLESHYEEFLSFQCHFAHNLDFVQNRQRDEAY